MAIVIVIIIIIYTNNNDGNDYYHYKITYFALKSSETVTLIGISTQKWLDSQHLYSQLTLLVQG